MPISRKKTVEVCAVAAVYFLFVVVGVYSGQTVMSVDIIAPADGLRFRSSPVELVARVALRGVPLVDVIARFTIHSGREDGWSTDTVTDSNGLARLVIPAPSGNYSWSVSAIKEGYPTIASRSSKFSITLSLVVYALLPSSSIVAISPVNFKARVTDMNGHMAGSANVTFYLDSEPIGSSLAGPNGIAMLSSPVAPGMHVWFAYANDNGEGGISAPVDFLVAQLASLGTGDHESLGSDILRATEDAFVDLVIGSTIPRYRLITCEKS
jgi:hypothetical protein